jgi:hypothetical protein
MGEVFGTHSSAMGPTQHGPRAAHLYFSAGTVAAEPVLAPDHDGVAA